MYTFLLVSHGALRCRRQPARVSHRSGGPEAEAGGGGRCGRSHRRPDDALRRGAEPRFAGRLEARICGFTSEDDGPRAVLSAASLFQGDAEKVDVTKGARGAVV